MLRCILLSFDRELKNKAPISFIKKLKEAPTLEKLASYTYYNSRG